MSALQDLRVLVVENDEMSAALLQMQLQALVSQLPLYCLQRLKLLAHPEQLDSTVGTASFRQKGLLIDRLYKWYRNHLPLYSSS